MTNTRLTQILIAIVAVAALVFYYLPNNPVKQYIGATVLYPSGGGTGTSTKPTYGQMLVGNANGTYTLTATSSLGITSGGGSGTVTAVDMVVPTGLSVSGVPFTTAGTSTITYSTGYSLPLTASTTEGSTAYAWGNHASQGYMTTAFATSTYQPLLSFPLPVGSSTHPSETDPVWIASSSLYAALASPVFTGSVTTPQLFVSGTYPGSSWGMADTNASHYLGFRYNTDISATRYLDIQTADANTGLNLSGAGGSLLYASSINTWTALASSSGGTVLMVSTSTGQPSWIATSSLGITSTPGSDSTWTLHNDYPTGCSGGQVVQAIGDTLTCVSTSTNANTASALLANGANCSSGQSPLGIDASGAVESCFDVWTEAENTSAAYLSAVGPTNMSALDFGSFTCNGTTCTIDNGSVGLTTQVTGVLPVANGGTGWASIKSTFIPFGNNGSAISTSSAFYFTSSRNELTVTNASTTYLSVATNSFLGTVKSGVWNGTDLGLAYIGGGVADANAYDFGGATSFELPNGASGFTNTTGQCFIDTTSGQLRCNTGTATSTFVSSKFPTFTSPATTTAWSGTSTWALGTARKNETWPDIQCYTDAGTLDIQVGDGTNWMNLIKGASTTANTFTLSTNNSFTGGNPGEKRYIRAGNPASSPTYFSCTPTINYDPD